MGLICATPFRQLCAISDGHVSFNGWQLRPTSGMFRRAWRSPEAHARSSRFSEGFQAFRLCPLAPRKRPATSFAFGEEHPI
jgi:hypothetical protein